MVDAIPQTMVVLGPDGGVVYVNRAVLDYTGLSTDELMEADFRNRVFHPEDSEGLRIRDERGFSGSVPWENEVRVLGKDGQYRWFLIRYNPLFDEEGRLLRWFAAGTDIDERKRSEERLREENLALREEIDRSSMYEEIVGSSGPLRKSNVTSWQGGYFGFHSSAFWVRPVPVRMICPAPFINSLSVRRAPFIRVNDPRTKPHSLVSGTRTPRQTSGQHLHQRDLTW